jgi:WD40 repeat protein/tRNA A-37 threonylcarbamoyl transferase component Bud32
MSDAATLPPDRPPNDTATLPPSPGARPAAVADPIPGYEVLGELGRGGMGVVYRARDTRLNRTVALKMVLAGAHADPRDLVRFLAEAEAVAAVEHPHVVRVFGYGEHDGRPYMALEFCDGGSLAGRISRSGRLTPKEAAAVVAAVARGVQAAHDLGIVHRDLKPANVLLTAPPGEPAASAAWVPKVTDFGLAKRGGGSGLTQTNAVMGTPAYMAPEQAKGQTKFVGPAADIYALGVILFECLAGRPPFDADDTIALILKVVEDDPPPLSRFAPAVPWDLDVIARKCLAKEPRERYPTAAALADDLDRWVRGEPISARPTTPAQRVWLWVRRNKVVAGLVAALLFAMIVGTIVSVAYGVKASINEQMARDNLDAAVASRNEAKAAEGQAKDALLRGQFEEAKAVRLARQVGWRDKVLTLLRDAAALRRDRVGPSPEGLPSVADLRGEAVMALTQRDATPVRKVPVNPSAATWFSPDGRRMFQQHYRTDPLGVVFVTTDLSTGRELNSTTADAPEQLAVFAGAKAFNTDGSRALSMNGDRGPVLIHELPSGKQVATLPEAAVDPKAPVLAGPSKHRLRFSPDGRRVLAVRCAGPTAEVVVWDVEKLTPARVAATHTHAPAVADLYPAEDTRLFPSLRFSPDGARVSFLTQDKKAVRVVDLSADPPTAIDVPLPSQAVVAEWHPTDPRLAVVVRGERNTQRVVLCDPAGKADPVPCEGEFETGSFARVSKVAFSPDGRWLAFNPGHDPTIHLYDARSGSEAFRLPDVAFMGVSHLFWTADGELATFGTMEALRFWKVSDDPPVEGYDGLRPTERAAFSPDGTRIAVFAPSGRVSADVKGIEDLEGAWKTSGLSRDRVAILDRRTGSVERHLDAFETMSVKGVLFSRDGRHVAMVQSAEVLVREVATGHEVVRRAGPKAGGLDRWVNAFYLADGTLVGLFLRQTKGKQAVVLWDVHADRPALAGTELMKLTDNDPGNPVTGVSGAVMERLLLSPEGDRCLVPAPPTMENPITKKRDGQHPSRLYELPSGKRLAEYDAAIGPRDYVFTERLGPAARRTLSVSMDLDLAKGPTIDKAVWVVHEVPSGAELFRAPATPSNSSEVTCEFGPDGRWMAVGAPRGYVEVWDIDAKELRFRWQPHGGKTVTGLTISPDGDIATVSEDDHRLSVLKMKEVRERLATLGLDW